jgi:8-oxo-dGTP diphosphatase
MGKQVCSGGFLMKKNRFLFGKRSKKKTWAPGVWDIIGGKSLKKEHPLYTLRREVLEEIGVTVLNAELMTIIDVKDEHKNETFAYHIYMVTHYKGKPANCSKEHTKIRWFTRKELSEVSVALPDYLKLIDDWFKGTNILNNAE